MLVTPGRRDVDGGTRPSPLAAMIRADKIHAIVCTGRETSRRTSSNLVAHDYYERVPQYRQLTARGRAWTCSTGT